MDLPLITQKNRASVQSASFKACRYYSSLRECADIQGCSSPSVC
uniref:Uncharacterized protein n=1 Tax=Arundo donax TaxID=35708 RepID=A0A0A9FVU2_ARUDO